MKNRKNLSKCTFAQKALSLAAIAGLAVLGQAANSQDILENYNVTVDQNSDGSIIYSIQGTALQVLPSDYGMPGLTTSYDLEDAIIRNNTGISKQSFVLGGAIYNEGTLTGTIESMVNNTAEAYAEAYGGALYSEGTLELDSITGIISGNSATSSNKDARGGALYISGQNAHIKEINADFSNNIAKGSDRYPNYGKGGAIYLGDGAKVDVIKGTFENNSAYYGAAIYAENIENLNIGDETLFKNNSGEWSILSTNEVDNLNIADDVTFTGNNARIIDVTFDSSKNGTVNIGNNFSIIDNNLSNDYENIYAVDMDKFIIGDNYKVKNNYGGFGAYISYSSSSGKNNIFKIGDNFEFSNNISGGEYHASMYPFNIFRVKDMEIGKNATIKDNRITSYFNYIFHLSANSSTQATNKLTFGDGLIIENNYKNEGTSGYIIDADDFGQVTFGDDTKIRNNTLEMLRFDGTNKLEFGDNFEYVNNIGSGYNPAIYQQGNSSNDSYFILGDNANLSGNKSLEYIFQVRGVKNFTIGDNLNISDNITREQLIYASGSGTFEIGDDANISDNIITNYSELMSLNSFNKVNIR